MTGLKVLIVDDQPFLRNLLKQIVLSNWPDVELATAGNGREALKLINSGDYDVLFLDIEMPVMSGIELLTEIRSHSLAGNSKIVMCTGCKGESKPLEAYNLGIDYFLRKPFEAHEIGLILDELRWQWSGALSQSF